MQLVPCIEEMHEAEWRVSHASWSVPMQEATGEAVEEVALELCSSLQEPQCNGLHASSAALAPGNLPALVLCTTPAQASRIEKHIKTAPAFTGKGNGRWDALFLLGAKGEDLACLC